MENEMKTRREFITLGSASAAATVIGGATANAIGPVTRQSGPRLKVSCCAYSYRDYLTDSRKNGTKASMTMFDFVDKCAAMGLDGVELTSYYFPTELTDDYLNKLKRRCFLNGVDVATTSVGNTFTVPKGPDRDKNIALVKKWIDASVKLGAPAMRIFAGAPAKGTSDEQARGWCIECIEECCDYSGKVGVILAMEDHGGIVGSAEGVLAICNAVKSEWFAVNLDVGNFRTADPYADIAKVAPYAVTTHIKTEIQPNGGAKQLIDMPRVIDLLRRANFRGYLNLEYEAAEDPMVAVPRTLELLKKLVSS